MLGVLVELHITNLQVVRAGLTSHYCTVRPGRPQLVAGHVSNCCGEDNFLQPPAILR